MNSSLPVALGRLERVRDDSPRRSGSYVALRLAWAGDICRIRTISAVQALVARGMKPLRAKRAIEALLAERHAFIEVPAVDSLDALLTDLAAAGVRASVAGGAVDVRHTRQRLGLTQEQFALRFGLDLDAVRNWEHGRRSPDLAARSYLRVIDAAPDAIEAALWGSAAGSADGGD